MLRTVAEIEPMIWATTKGGKPTAKSEEYKQLMRSAIDHPEMYNEDRFARDLREQVFRLGVLEKRLGELNDHAKQVEFIGRYKYPDWCEDLVAKVKSEINACKRYINTCKFVLGERGSI